MHAGKKERDLRKVFPGAYVGTEEVEGLDLDCNTLPPAGPFSMETQPKDHLLPCLLSEKSKRQYLPFDSH